MPCAATPRGLTDAKLPWSDAINNNPCGKPIVSTVNGVSVAAQNLCLGHFAMKNGLTEVKGAIVFGA
jgi:hypothetical protein